MKNLLTLALCAIALSIGSGCGNSNSGGGGSSGASGAFVGPQPTVDLAVSDPVNNQVAIYLDILNFFNNGGTGNPTPDISFDSIGSGLQTPTSIYQTADDLVVCDGTTFIVPGLSGNDEVYVFRDYRDHASGDLPDIIFTNGGTLGTITDPNQCFVDEAGDNLIVVEAANDTVKIVRDYSGIADGADPAATVVTLNGAGSLLDTPINIAVDSDGDLYAANNTATSPGDPAVTIYRDISTLVNANAPDVELDFDVSFFDLATSFGIANVTVGPNPFDATSPDALFVTAISGYVFVFNDADAVVTNDLPDAVLFGSESGLGVLPLQSLIAGSRLYVSNFNAIGSSPNFFCVDAPAVTGFDSTNGLFETGQPASFGLGENNGHMLSAMQMDLAGGALVVAADPSCLGTLTASGAVVLFANGLQVDSSFQPGLVIEGEIAVGTDSFALPIAIDARERDSGT